MLPVLARACDGAGRGIAHLGFEPGYYDPERLRAKSIFRQRVSSPRVRVVRCREEKRKNRTLSDLTETETVSVSPVKATPRSALGSGEFGFERKALKQRQKV